MGKSVRCLVHLLILMALIASSAAPAGWARESRSFVKEAWAWTEDGELRFQAELRDSADKLVLTLGQDGKETARTFCETSKLSVAILPASASVLTIEVKALSGKAQSIRWELAVPDAAIQREEGLEIKERPWDKKAAKKQEKLELIPVSSLPAEDDDATEEELTEEDEVQADVAKMAKRFYDAFDKADKPRESALRARPAVFELEPNDTFAKADWLFDQKDAHGKIGKMGDVDMWKIKAPKDGSLNLSLRDIPLGRDYNLYIFDEQNRELGRSEREGGEDESIQGIFLQKNQWYYVMVNGSKGSYHDTHYYRLRADFLSGQGDTKLDEYEPNNRLADAHQVDADASLTGSLHSLDDVDFYRFSFSLAATLILDLQEMPEGMDMDLYLLDEAGNTLSKSEKPKNANEQIVLNANPGTYAIKVMPSKRSGFSANSYKLSISTKTIPVILIPGIGGSRLEVEEKGNISEIWLAMGDSFIGINDPRHRRLLSLEPVKQGSTEVRSQEKGIRIFPEREDEGFRAIEYLSYSELTPIKDATEQYNSMVKELQKMGYKKFRTLFAMPYDWRYSSTTNAAQLKQKIDLALERTGARQVHLVAHSMGGLLVRETLLSNVSYQKKVNRVIYMGTPFLGSPRAYQAIRYGYNFSIPWMDEETGQIISRYAPAVYELLPSQKYIEITPYLRKNKTDPYSYDDFLQDKAIRLDYGPLVTQAGRLHEKWDNKTINVLQYSIIGQGQPTLLGYYYDRYHAQWTPYFDKGLGDGTVPYISANYAQKDIKKRYYVKGEHAKLPILPEVIQQVSRLLKGEEGIQPGILKAANKKTSYLYYMLSREDGAFPQVTVIKSGTSLEIRPEKKEVMEDLNIEYHGNIVVIHVRDGEPLTFRTLPSGSGKKQGRVLIECFSSDDSSPNEESGSRYWLEP